MGMKEDLIALLSESQVSTGQSVLEQHSHDESYHTPHLPDVVVFPESTEEVVKVVSYAHERRIPMVPYGVGSGLEGHVVPVHGGICLDMSRMNRILAVRPNDFTVRVQPGVTRKQLNEALRRQGLFFSVDPGADATIGGMAATNASGTTTVRYGAMRDNVRQLEVVLADGRVIRTGSATVKSSSGLHLTGLFVGSEGTLGVITEITLRVYGLPERIIAARAEFPDEASCVQAAIGMIGAGVPVARVELVDPTYISAFNRFRGTTYNPVPTLFLEFHGTRGGIAHDVALARDIAVEEGCTDFLSVDDETERNRLWETRHNALHCYMAQFPGLGHMSTDVCVPLSELPKAIDEARQSLQATGARGAIIGHVGDGNFHISLAMNPNDPADLACVLTLNQQVVEYALSVGGTCTGEHGVGLGKRKYQSAEHGLALDVMRQIKSTLDPLGIMNPGKLVDPETE